MHQIPNLAVSRLNVLESIRQLVKISRPRKIELLYKEGASYGKRWNLYRIPQGWKQTNDTTSLADRATYLLSNVNLHPSYNRPALTLW